MPGMMRSIFGIKALLIANLVWTTILLVKWGSSHSEKNSESLESERNDNLANDYSVINAVKRTLRLKYPSDKELFTTYFEKDLPTIFAVTSTYSRWTQKADLTRLCQTFLHVPNFYWVIVEDSDVKTDLVARFLENCEIPHTHLTAKTDEKVKMKESDPSWLMPRGVVQRNTGLKWLRENVKPGTPGVLYFIDDDNTYSLRIFEEMRFTQKVSVWPVGIVGGLKFEGPLCKDGKVTSWYTAWKPERPFPIDMAAFAVNMDLVMRHPEAVFSNNVQRGYQESHFLTKLTTKDELEPKANDCSEILVWHTRTEKPNMKQELKLQKIGKSSDPNMEV